MLSAVDHLSIQRHMENLNEYDADFRRHHFAVVELVNEDDLVAEQAVLDEYSDKVTDYMDHLRRLLPIPEKAYHKASDKYSAEGLFKRLRYIIRELTSLNDSVDSVASGPGIDACLLRQLQRRVNSMDTALVDVAHKILSLDEGEEELMKERFKVRKILLEVDLKFERMLQDVECSLKINKTDTVGFRLTKISVSTFDGSMEHLLGAI